MRKVMHTVWACCSFMAVLAACSRYSSFDEMASDMCAGRATDVQWMEWDSTAVLIDVRSKEEYAVSHLYGSRTCTWANGSLEDWNELPRDRKLVLYCSVGKRSEEAAEFLLDHGFSSVVNLKGGLFAAFNAGMAMDQSNQVMQRIHGYNERWGKWITRGEVSYE